MCVTVYTQYRRVTDKRRTDGRTDILPRPSPRYAYASRGKNDTRYGHSYNGRRIGTGMRYISVAAPRA